ncbi:hypothetical protein E4656_16605 [Natronospirillum operosum]|uniref:Uncharacterized protein n=1 Tax=Natronospirillum operosum TaxID=2759953 RepID=A0A4Z0W2Y2_9GAMM|nr:hypothetical protein [Natronospirillum operosum]TGG91339.1 hypothetical protein E4656_16605 [Natronospirillum operosum]
MIKPDEFLKKYGFDEEDTADEEDHSLERQARDRARHLKRPNAGTPHDWEEWQRLQGDDTDDDDESGSKRQRGN